MIVKLGQYMMGCPFSRDERTRRRKGRYISHQASTLSWELSALSSSRAHEQEPEEEEDVERGVVTKRN